MRLCIKAGFVLVILVTLSACTKNNEPFQITVKSGIDSLTLQSIQFFAFTSETADSYIWDFGDGGTAAAPFVQHIYQKMGMYTVSCTATVRERKYTAAMKFEVKGDSRIVGQRRFYGTHTYSITPSNLLGPPPGFVTATIADTVLTFTAPSHFQLYFINSYTAWQHDTGTEVQYQFKDYFQNRSTLINLYYYPANDSAYIRYNHFGIGDISHEYILYQKR